MDTSQLTTIFLDQSKYLHWMVDRDFQLVYANKQYFNFMNQVTKAGKKMGESVFIEEFGREDVEQWKGYYQRALEGDSFEIGDHFYNKVSEEIQYSQVVFEPLVGDDGKVFSVACTSKKITREVQKKMEAYQMMDASLDVLCAVNEDGVFVSLNGAVQEHWGYTAEELVGTRFMNLIVEEDVAKTEKVTVSILNGSRITSFVNRYKRKDGSIAYNSWSTRWDESAKLMYGVARDAKETIAEEEIIQQSEQRFKALVQDGSDLISILDEHGNYRYASPNVKPILGYDSDELIGKSAFEFIHPEDLEIARDQMERLKEKNSIKMEPFRFKNHAGDWRWVETVLTNMVNNPAVKGVVANSRDISEKVEREEMLRQSEKRFKALVQEGLDLFAIIDVEGFYTYMSSSSASIIGIPPEEFIGKNSFEYVHPEDHAKVLSSLKKIAITSKLVMEPYRAKNLQGEWRWVQTTLTNMLDRPEVDGIVVNSRDITEETEEKHQLKLLESVITNSTDAVLITEAEHLDEPGPKIIYVNEAFTRMTGYTAEEVIGKTPRILQGPNSDWSELNRLSRALRNWETCQITTINYNKKGEQFWVNFTVSPVMDVKGRYTHWTAIQRDVSDEKNEELERDLIRKLSDTFSRNVGADITPCLLEVCEQVSSVDDFSFSEIWLPSADNERLNRVASYSGSKAGEKFYDLSSKDSYNKGDGISDQVLKSKETVIVEVTDDAWKLLKSKTAAKKAGIKTIIAVPLIHNEELIGGLLIGTEKSKANLSVSSDLFRKIETTIGSELSRKKIEKELSQIFNFTPDLICVTGFDGYVKRINPAGLEILEYSLEEICSRPLKTFVHPEDQEATAEKQAKLHNGESISNFENRYITKKGKIVWLSWTATSSAEQGIIYGVAKDITEQKGLRELNRLASKLTKIGSFELDLVNETVFWTEEIHEICETDFKTYVPTLEESINFYREDFQEMVLENLETAIKEGGVWDYEAVIVTYNKKEKWIRSVADAEFINGKCVRIYGGFQDINDRKQSEIRLESFAKNLPGVAYQYRIDAEGNDSLHYVSNGVKQVWGFTPEEVMASMELTWEQIRAGGEMDKVTASIAHSIKTKTKWTCTYKYALPSGEIRTHLGYGMPSFMVDGTILFNSIVLDVTKETKNEDLLQLTGKLAKIGGWEVDVANNAVYFTKETHRIHETDPDSFIPNLKDAIDFYREDFRDLVKSKVEESIQTGESFEFEAVLVTANKKELWVRSSGSAEFINGVCTRVYGSFQDIHLQKTVQIELEKSLQAVKDYKFALDEAAIIVVTDSKGIITSANDNFCKISNYSQKEIVGKTHRLINSGYHEKEFFNDLWKTISSGNVWRGEIRNKAKGGKHYWVDTTIVPFLDKKGKPLQYLTIRFDITERRKAENDLSATTERLRLATTTANIGIWDWDVVNNNLIWDESMYRIFGVEKNKFKGAFEAWSSTIHPEDIDQANKEVQNALKGLTKFNTEFRVVWPDKSIRYVTGNAFVIRDEVSGEALRMIGTNVDITERRVAEKEKDSFRITVENSLNEIYVFDAKTLLFTYVNKGSLLNLGYSKKEIENLTPVDIKPDYTISSFKKLVKPLVNGEKDKLTFFTNHKRKAGSIYPAEVHLQLVTESSEHRFLAVVIDITDRKKAEEEILQANERFKKVTEATKDAIWDWDIKEGTLYRSKAIEGFFGKGTTLALSEKDFWTDRFHPEDVDRVNESVQEAIADPTCFRWEAEYRLYNKEKELIYIIDRGVIVRDEHGKAIRMVGSMTNITELKESERENRFKANLLKTIGQAAVATDVNGIVNYWNRAAEDIYGWKHEEAFGKDVAMLTPADTNQQQVDEILSLLKKGQTWTGEFEVQRKDKTKFPVRVTNSPFYDDNKNMSGMIGISTDITEEVESKRLIEQYTKELERSNQELEQFAFIASHDLQEPLRMVTSFMDLLKRRYADELDEKAHQYIHFATDGASRMKQIILDLLEYSRSTRPDENTIEVDFNELVSDFKQLRRNLMEEKQATLTFKNLPTLVTYRAVVTQIIHCLLDNALKYTKKGIPVEVKISAVENKKEWKFSVKDNGIGIEPQFYSKIFAIFQRLHNKEEYAGTGIGLSIAKRHVEFLGGEIWLKSELGKGTVFYFTVPKIN